MKKIIILAAIFLFAAACSKNVPANQNGQDNLNTPQEQSSSRQTEPTIFAEPISDAKSRITKKPFGIYVTPAHSPVSPEKFTGYHTGVDFETTSDEKDSDVQISAICDGKVLEKKYATGYGGVLVQSCTLNDSPITVIYGHLRLSSIQAKQGEALSKGRPFAVLGTGYSSETDGERKHLHLGIHRGGGTNIKGYVQNQSELDGWINFEDYLK